MSRSWMSGLVLIAAVLSVPPSSGARQPDWELAQRMPAETVIYVSTARIAELREAYKTSAVWKIATQLPIPKELMQLDKVDAALLDVTGLDSTQLPDLFGGELSLAIQDINFEKMERPPAVIFRAGLSNAALYETFEARIRAKLTAADGPHIEEDWEGTKVHCFRTKKEDIFYTMTGNTFYFATDAELLKRILAGPSSSSLARAADFNAGLEVTGRDGDAFAFANLKRLLSSAKPIAMKDSDGQKTWDMVGLDSLGWFAGGARMADAGHFIDTVVVNFATPPTGILGLLSGMEAGPQAALSLVPKNATLAYDVNVASFPKMWERIVGFVEVQGDPQGPKDFEAELKRAGDELGIDLRAQILDHLQGEVAMFATIPDVNPGVIDNPLLIGGILPELRVGTLIEVSEGEAVAKTIRDILQARQVDTSTTPYKGTDITDVGIPGAPEKPAFAVYKNWFLIGFGRHSVEQMIDAEQGEGLQSALPAHLGAGDANYTNYAELVQIAKIYGGIAVAKLHQEEANQPESQPKIDWSKMQPVPELAALLGPQSATAHFGKDRWTLQSDSPLAGIMSVSEVGIVAAIAIPSFLRSRMAANEAAAAATLKNIASAQTLYQMQSDSQSFAESLDKLGSGDKPLIDGSLAGGQKSGYVLTVTGDEFHCPDGKVVPSPGENGVKEYDCKPGEGGVCSLHSKPGAYHNWHAEAHPTEYQRTGVRSFYLDESGILRAENNGGQPGTPAMPEL